MPASDPLGEGFHPRSSCIPGVCYCLVFRRFIERELGAFFGHLHHSYLTVATDICFITGGWSHIYDSRWGVRGGASTFSHLKVKLIVKKLVLGIKAALRESTVC